jgi:hypothetical protein
MPKQKEADSGDEVPEPKVRRISTKDAGKNSEGSTGTKEEPPPASPDAEGIPKPDKKRSNRRRRGKGKSGAKEIETLAASQAPVEEIISLAVEDPKPRPEQKDRTEPRDKPQENRPQQPQKPRRKPDPGKVAKNAWKIFLAEVSEEGVALIADNDARELARRCFRLSEIFLEEEEKRG